MENLQTENLEKVETVALSAGLVAQMVQYLSTRPVGEVNNLYNAINNEAEPQFQKLIEAQQAEKE